MLSCILEATVSGSERQQELSFPGAKGPGHFAPGSECSTERNDQGANWPESERATGQGANWPRSERAGERKGQGPIGRFAPGSELARERKGSVPNGKGWMKMQENRRIE